VIYALATLLTRIEQRRQIGNCNRPSVPRWRSAATLPQCLRSIRSRSRSSTAFWSVSTGCSRTSSNVQTSRNLAEERTHPYHLAKVVIYEAFVEGKLEAPKHLARTVHNLYFDYFDPNMMSSGPGRFGASLMRSRRDSRNWILFRSSRQLRNWVSSWRRGSHSRSRCGPRSLSLATLIKSRQEADEDASRL
jgi:hypothetical protein